MRIASAAAVVSAAVLAGCVASGPALQADGAQLDRRHFAATATVEEGGAAGVLIDTRAGNPTRGSAFEVKRGDVFLRAILNPKTGIADYMLYQSIIYRDYHWHFYNAATFTGPAGPEAPLRFIQISRDVDCSGGRGTGCTYEEHVGFALPVAVLDAAAREYEAGRTDGELAYRFTSREADESFAGAVSYAEIAGLLERVAAYREGLGATK